MAKRAPYGSCVAAWLRIMADLGADQEEGVARADVLRAGARDPAFSGFQDPGLNVHLTRTTHALWEAGLIDVCADSWGHRRWLSDSLETQAAAGQSAPSRKWSSVPRADRRVYRIRFTPLGAEQAGAAPNC